MNAPTLDPELARLFDEDPPHRRDASLRWAQSRLDAWPHVAALFSVGQQVRFPPYHPAMIWRGRPGIITAINPRSPWPISVRLERADDLPTFVHDRNVGPWELERLIEGAWLPTPPPSWE